MFLLATVVADDLAQNFASLTDSAGNIGGIDFGGWEETRVVLSPLVFQATLSLLFLPSLFVGGLAILGPREIWRKECGLVLSLSFLGWLVSRIPSGGGLGLGYSSMSGAITSWAMLIHLSKDGERLEAINCFLRLVRPNCLASSRIIPSLGLDRRLTPFSKELNEVGLSGALSASNLMD